MTQQPDPVVYPIWPLSATRSMRACRRLQYSAVATGHHLRSRLYQILVPGSASDLTCNLVSLCADLARHWGKAHFGLKWYSSLATGAGDGLSTVLLEFHWLPESISRAVDGCLVSSDDRGKDEARRRVSLDDVEGLAESLRGTLLSASRVSCRGAARDCHGRPWESGRLLEVRMAAGDVEDFKTLIEGQWLMVRIAALSGAAEDVERFGDGLPLAP